MRRAAALVIAATFCVGCNTAKDYPLTTIVIPGNYSRVAACAYSRLSEESSIGITHAEMSGIKTAEIRSSSGAVMFYEARFIGNDETTRLEVRALPTIRGTTFYAEKIRDAALSCG
jgi:hypothetical protein